MWLNRIKFHRSRTLAQTYVWAIHYHRIPVNESVDFVFWDPWEHRKIDQITVTNYISATRAVTNDMPFWWVHEDHDIERTPSDESCDNNGYIWVNDSLLRMNQALNQSYDVVRSSSGPNIGISGSMAPAVSNSDKSSAILLFIEETSVISSGEPAMSLLEIRAFVRGRPNS